MTAELPQATRSRLDAWAGCIAGALDEAVYLDKIRAAGFEQVEIASRDHASADEILEQEDAQLVIVGLDGPIEGEEARALLAEADVSSGAIQTE